MDDAADQDEGAEMEMELEVSPSRVDVEMELKVSRPVTAPPQPGAFAASSTCCSDDECGHVRCFRIFGLRGRWPSVRVEEECVRPSWGQARRPEGCAERPQHGAVSTPFGLVRDGGNL